MGLPGTNSAMTARMHRGLLALVLSLALAPACSSQSPTVPTTVSTPLSLSGTWAGTLSVGSTTARMTWTLSQSNADVTGPALVTLPSGMVLLNGTLSGTVASSVLTYTIAVGPGGIPTQPACVGQLGGTMTATLGVVSTLAGNYAVRSSSCTTPFAGGALTLNKQ
jgi:hypothetical protein